MAVGVNIVSDFDAKGIKKAIADFKKLEGAGNKATFGLRTFDSAVTNGVKNLAKFGAIAGAAAGVIGVKLAGAAYESQKALAQTEAIIKATGGAANITGQQVSALSEKLSMQIGVDDELIQTSANLLLTFKQVQNQVGENNDIFNQAVTLSQDLGNVFGSADAAAMQLGKALSDPEKGITALRRAGINFTESQKEQIATLVASGDVLGAQKLILAEVESQVGGTAAATATSFDIMRVAIGNVAERFGALLIPVIERFAKFVIESVVPYLNRLAEVMGEQGIGGGLRMLAGDFLTAVSNGGKFVNTLLLLTTAFIALRGVAILATIAQTLFNAALLKNPIGLIVTAIYLLGVGLVAAYVKFEGFRKVVHAVVNASIAAWEFMTNAIIKGINFLIDAYNGLIKIANFFGAGIKEVGKIGEVSFGRIGNAADKANDRISKTLGMIQSVKNAERMSVTPVRSIGGGGGLTEGVDGIGGGGGGQSPIEKAKQALEKYIDAVKGLTSAQKSLRDANKGVNQSNETLLEKTKALTEAQRKFNLVTKGYGADSKEAKDADKERTKAERAAERAKYALEQAVFAVSEAEKELAEIRKDPQATPQMIREAEIRLAESKLRVADATDEQVESSDALVASQNRLNEAVNGAKEGSDAYNEALKELADAERDQRSAIDARTEAYERQAEAVEKLAEAERDRIAAGKGVSKSDRAAVDASVPSVVAGVVAPVVDAIGRAIEVIPAPVAGGGFSQDELDGLGRIGRGDFSGIDLGLIRIPSLEELLGGGMGTLMANGGVVTRATSIIAGEAGAEAIIPLDRLGSFGSTYNISVTAGMGADGKDIGTQIVNALKRYERTNGALPLTVQ